MLDLAKVDRDISEAFEDRCGGTPDPETGELELPGEAAARAAAGPPA